MARKAGSCALARVADQIGRERVVRANSVVMLILHVARKSGARQSGAGQFLTIDGTTTDGGLALLGGSRVSRIGTEVLMIVSCGNSKDQRTCLP